MACNVIAKKRRRESGYNLSVHLQYWTVSGYPVDVVALGHQQHGRYSYRFSRAYRHYQEIPADGIKRSVEVHTSEL